VSAAAPRVSIIVATDEAGAIGRDGQLPWHLPDDLKRFKALTLGKPIIMGRKTWESIWRPLPGRHNIVVTRQPDYSAVGCSVVTSLPAALDQAGEVPEVCVIGGAEIYRLALPMTTVIHLTQVHARVPADTWFPALEPAQWREVRREPHPVDERHAWSFTFLELVRVP
jgi:dihydrofolate reductase